MTNKTRIGELVKKWRDVGPVVWAESRHGWICPDGKPVVLTDWQRAVLTAWFENSDTVTTLAISNVKKTGKTFVNAVLTAWRWLTLPGEHFTVANDQDQAAGRQYSEIAEMCKRHPYLKGKVKVGKKETVFTPTGSRLTALPTDATGNAGANHLTASHTETWGILHEGAIRSYEELTPPPGKFYGYPCLRICDSYAGWLQESRTWHNLVDRGLAGERLPGDWPIWRAGGLMLFHIEGQEAQRRCFRGTQTEADAYYRDQRDSLRNNTFTRLHENQRSENESTFILPEMWAACLDPALVPFGPGDTRWLVLGADASTTRDSTALVGTCWNWDKRRVDVVYIKTWRPVRGVLRMGRPTIDLEQTLGQEVLRLYQLRAIQKLLFDPYQLHTLGLTWEKMGINVVEFPQTVARVEADMSLYAAIRAKSLAHYGDATLTRHVTGAIAVETPRGFRIAKEKATRKIDAAVALSMSHHGAVESAHDGTAQRTEYRSSGSGPGLLIAGASRQPTQGRQWTGGQSRLGYRDKHAERNRRGSLY